MSESSGVGPNPLSFCTSLLPFVFIRCSHIKHIFHRDFVLQSKGKMYTLKTDPCKGIALLKSSIPVKLSLNREIKEIAPGCSTPISMGRR